MKCSNCGMPYKENETTCIQCGQPIGNAAYSPVSKEYEQKRKKRLCRRLLSVLILVLILAGGCFFGYRYYIGQVVKNCRKATRQIFQQASQMDFSSVDPSYLPEILRDNPNIRELIRQELDSCFGEGAADYVDTDWLCDQILESAYYEITGASADYHSCKVTVHTENIDFTAIPDLIYDDIQMDPHHSSGLWDMITDFLSSLWSGGGAGGGMRNIEELFEKAREQAPKTSCTGTFEYGIADGKWTLISLDQNLFYSYYGLGGHME